MKRFANLEMWAFQKEDTSTQVDQAEVRDSYCHMFGNEKVKVKGRNLTRNREDKHQYSPRRQACVHTGRAQAPSQFQASCSRGG